MSEASWIACENSKKLLFLVNDLPVEISLPPKRNKNTNKDQKNLQTDKKEEMRVTILIQMMTVL